MGSNLNVDECMMTHKHITWRFCIINKNVFFLLGQEDHNRIYLLKPQEQLKRPERSKGSHVVLPQTMVILLIYFLQLLPAIFWYNVKLKRVLLGYYTFHCNSL